MKSKLINILQNLSDRKVCFCTLCFASIDEDDLQKTPTVADKVILKNGNEENFADILKFIFTPEITTDFLTSYICQKCAKSVLSTYSLTKMVRENNRFLSDVTKKLSNVLISSLEENLDCFKTIFLFNGNLKFVRLFDTEGNINSLETAKLRLESNLSKENNENIFIELEPQQKKYVKWKEQRPKINKIELNKYQRDGENVKCNICFRVFAAMKYFRSHYYRLHAPKTVECPKCPKVFGSTSILNQHRLECHIDAICTQCGKAFNSSHYLKQHELSHRINFPCEKCKRVYKTKETYNIHLREKICLQKQRKTKSDARFTCDICDKRFCHKSSLKIHIGFAHGSGKAYECKYCNKAFSFKSQFYTHMLTHTKFKKFNCTFCSLTFTTKKGLTVHTRSHTGKKP